MNGLHILSVLGALLLALPHSHSQGTPTLDASQREALLGIHNGVRAEVKTAANMHKLVRSECDIMMPLLKSQSLEKSLEYWKTWNTQGDPTDMKWDFTASGNNPCRFVSFYAVCTFEQHVTSRSDWNQQYFNAESRSRMTKITHSLLCG